MTSNTLKHAKLILEDGTEYAGRSFGYPKSTSGEVVFNTGMVGYVESLTDPSYSGQILTLTYPLIGNYGVPSARNENEFKKYFESDKIQAQGLVVSEYCPQYSHWQAKKSLGDWLKEHKIPAIHGIDTRELAKKLRAKGVMLGKIIIDKPIKGFADPNKTNLVQKVSCKKTTTYGRGLNTVLAVDCGMKNNILRSFLTRNIKVKRVPWDYDFTQEKLQGLFISNGPGDPMMCKKTIHHIRQVMKRGVPIFGICLGSQLLALAAGAKTYKLKYGHRSQNQPCLEIGTKRCYITSQNHGYAVSEKSLPKDWQSWFVNANDNTNEGIRHKSKPWLAVQFHPEASPGPTDTGFLFDEFVGLIKKWV